MPKGLQLVLVVCGIVSASCLLILAVVSLWLVRFTLNP